MSHNRLNKISTTKLILFIGLILIIAFGNYVLLSAQGGGEVPARDMEMTRQALFEQMVADRQPAIEAEAQLGRVKCEDGYAGNYHCQRIDLLAQLPMNKLGGGEGNDIWGWTDPQTGKEYALMGRTNGTAFVDVSNPENPVYLGNLPSHNGSSIWRDVKVYANHAFVVADNIGSHGMQVFDLTELRSVASPPQNFSETAHYDEFGSAHNIVINEDTGYAYVVGGDCSGGMHMINIQNPLNPVFAGCVSSDGYTHDAQCVVYHGPDSQYQDREICLNANEDTVTIFDVSDKSKPVQLSRTGYSGSRYTHQGWLTDDHRYYLLDDELDEQRNGHNTRTYIWDVSDLNAPILISQHTASNGAIDHNLYNNGNLSYQANYQAGLRIFDISDIANGNMKQVGIFDTYPAGNFASFNGAWSVYPYFESDTLIVSTIEHGLFVLQDLPSYEAELTPNQVQYAMPGQSITYSLKLQNTGTQTDAYTVSLRSKWQAELLYQGNVSTQIDQLSLDSQHSADVLVRVTLPLSVSNAHFETAIITATSQTMPSVTTTAELKAVATTTQTVIPVDPASALTKTFSSTVGQLVFSTTIHLPTGAISPALSLVYTPLDETAYPAPADFEYLNLFFALDAVANGTLQPGFVFDKPLILSIDYNDMALDGLDEDTLVLRYWREATQEWSTQGISVLEHDKANNKLVISLAHLSEFALLAQDIHLTQPVLQIDKTVEEKMGTGSLNFLPGGVVTYTITIQNDGAVTANGVVITDVVPSELLFGGMAQGSMQMPSQNTLVWGPFDIAFGISHTLQFTATIGAGSVQMGQTISNTAWYNSANGGTGSAVVSFVVGHRAQQRLYLPLVLKN